jgi:hypothetical protein
MPETSAVGPPDFGVWRRTRSGCIIVPGGRRVSIRFENTTRIEPGSPAASVTLDGFAEAVATAGGLELRGLAPLDALEVWTRNSRYRITVLDPVRCRVLIEGGAFFPVLAEATIGGASCGGSMLKVGWIIQGFCLEVFYPGGRIVTTCVRSMRTLQPDAGLRPF